MLPKSLKPSKHRIALRDGRELQYHLPLKDLNQRLSLRDCVPEAFAEAPLEVEIGCGKGEFIAKRAPQNPKSFFIGIDRRLDRFELTKAKLERASAAASTENGLNWAIVREDARLFLESGLPAIDRLHIYHPDPWPKARHHKHRFFRSPDARRWAEALKVGGILSVSTDHKEYFDEILDIIDSWPMMKNLVTMQKTHLLGAPLTHFEKYFLGQREPVFKAVWERLKA
jgi:tRNA (guanine-N7-)-methyltransferase